MAPTERRYGRRGLWAAALAGAVALAPAAPVLAQGSWGTAIDGPARVTDLVAQGAAALSEGRMDEALRLFDAANDLTYEIEDLPALVLHMPNLAQARYYTMVENWTNAGTFASSVATALDTPEHEHHPYRTEALALQGIAAYRLGRLNEADLTLRSALPAARAAGMDGVAAETLHHLALTATDLSAPDAAALREETVNSWTPDSPIPAPEVLYVFYRDLKAERAGGADPADLLPVAEEFLRLVDGVDGIDPMSRSTYRGVVGLLMSEAGNWETARPIFEERHAFLTEAEAFDFDYYWNVQYLSYAMAMGEEYQAAIDFVSEMVPHQERHLGAPLMDATLRADIGLFHNLAGDEAAAQAAFREAYGIMRSVHEADDRSVLRLREFIDPEDPGYAGFAYAHEVSGDGAADLALTPDGAAVLASFFSGRYVTLRSALATAESGEDAVYLANLALYHALTGAQDDARAAARRAREAARAAPEGVLSPDAPVLDIAEVIALIWGNNRGAAEADAPLAALLARAESLEPGMRATVHALAAYRRWGLSDNAGLRDQLTLWQAAAGPPRDDIWDIFAASALYEAVFSAADAETVAALRDRLDAALAQRPDLTLMHDYVELSRLLNSENAIAGDEGLAALVTLTARVAAQVPSDHSVVTGAYWGLAVAYQWRNRADEALQWMRRATDSLRRNRYHDPEVLAYLTSEQARLLLSMNEVNRAAHLAKQAYDMVDFTGELGANTPSVLEVYANAIWWRSGSAERAAEILEAHLEDPTYFDRLPEFWKVRQLQQYASALKEFAGYEEVVSVLERALAAIPDDDVIDWRNPRSVILWTRAIAAHHDARPGEAFAAMTRANDIYYDWVSEMLREGASGDITAAAAADRAEWEAAIGWNYASALADD
ncbi:hypothetical protein DXV76_03100 [Rhodobacteraceae bacterium CCMM004]|nr:hypothetical protein DXV76_03100 [Rhodobacteraceae bacterium CCMM004]